MSKDLGQALRMLRKHSELTQKQVADVLHIDRSTYAYYERGTTEPDLKSIKMLAKIFNVEPADILPENDGGINVCLNDVTAFESQEIPKEALGKLDPRDEKIYTLSKDEQSFLIWYRTLTAEQKAKLKDIESKE